MNIAMRLQRTNETISVCLEWLSHNEYDEMKDADFEWKNEISRGIQFLEILYKDFINERK